MAWLRCTGSPREETVPVSPSAGPSAPPDRPTSSTLSGWSVTSWSGTKAARPSRGLEQPFGFQPRPEARRVRKKMRLHPDRPRPIDVDEPVVDEQRLRRRSEEHTSELQSLMRISYAVFCLKKKKPN